MTCGDYQERFSDYLSGEMEDDQKKVFDEHLAECPDCRLHFKEMKTVWKELGDFPESEPSPALRSRFYAMLAREKYRQEEKPSVSERFGSWIAAFWPRRPAYQFAMALVFLAVGLLAGSRLRPDVVRNGEIAGLQREIADLRQAVSISLMNQASSTERLRGVQYSSEVESPSAPLITTLLNKLNNDPNVNIRLAAIEALYVFSRRPAVRQELIASLSKQTSPLVQVSLIDLLVDVREGRSLDAMRELIQNENTDQNVKQYTETRMSELM
jgi:hypothetical protein